MSAARIRLGNSAREDPPNSGRWRWSVWVEAPDKVLRRIKSVEYTLHPTFPEPIRNRKNWRTSFRLDGAGWGEFTIHARLDMADGSRRQLTRWLKLEEAEEPAPRDATGSARGAARARPTRLGPEGRRKVGDVGNLGRRKQTVEPTSSVKRVFISHSVSDRPFVEELRKHLTNHKVESITAETHMPPGIPWESWLKRIIATSDAVMVLLGKTPNAGVTVAAGVAFGLKRKVIPVTLGSEVVPPGELGEPVRLDPGPDAAEMLALRVASMLTA